MATLKALNLPLLLIFWSGLQTCGRNPFPRDEYLLIAHAYQGTLREAYRPFLSAPDPATRFRLCLCLANTRDTLLTEPLGVLLQDDSPLVREGAAFALGQLDCQEARTRLLARLATEKDRSVQKQIVIALGVIGDQTTLTMLIDESQRFSSAILTAGVTGFFTRQIYSPAAVNYCLNELKADTGATGQWIAASISRLRDGAILRSNSAALLEIYQRSSTAVRVKIMAALSAVDFPEKTALIENALQEPDARLRVEAARALQTLSATSPVVWQALSDSNPQVVTAALENLPPGLSLGSEYLHLWQKLARHASRQVRGALIRYRVTRYGPDGLRQIDRVPLDQNLQPDYALGLVQWGRASALPLLEALLNSPQRLTATTAYAGALELSRKLLDQHALTLDEYRQWIASGLNSNDPVWLALAADAMHDTTLDLRILETRLLNGLRYYRQFEYKEAVQEILATVAVLRPPAAAPFLRSIATSADRQLRQAAQSVLRTAYEDRAPLRYQTGTEKLTLAKLRRYGLQPQVELITERGRIVIELDGFYAPITVDAFLRLVERGFYNGLTFHRVVPNFVVQGGCPRGDGWGGTEIRLITERSPLNYSAGSVGMARAGYDSEGSQFFITLTDQPHLDYKYTRFGKVLSGMEIVAQLERGDRILALRILPASD